MWWIAIVALGIVGLATGALSRRASIDKKINELQGSDPEVAQALRDAQRDIDQGRFYGGL